jgi:hypothetical protein
LIPLQDLREIQPYNPGHEVEPIQLQLEEPTTEETRNPRRLGIRKLTNRDGPNAETKVRERDIESAVE